MTLFKGSRYRFKEAIQAMDADGNVEAFYPLRDTTLQDPIPGSARHLVLAGETFESLADMRYADATKWYIIADANPQIFWPLDLTEGVEIIIPPRSYAELS